VGLVAYLEVWSMTVQSRRFGTPRVIAKYIAVMALMASGLTVGLAGVAAADNVPTTSTVGASPLVVPADGVTTSTITVTLGTNAGATDSVSLAGVNANSSKINGGTAGASASIAAVGRIATFTVTDTVGQAVTYQATDTTDGSQVVNQTATVTFEGTVALSPVAGTFTSSAFAEFTQSTTTLEHAGDVLVIWIEEDPTTPPASIHVTAIAADPTSTGAIGTPVEAIDHIGTNVGSDIEIWYAPVTVTGAIELDYTWSAAVTTVPTDREQYSTEEFQPASPATYSTGATGSAEFAASTTVGFPTLTSTAGELYAGSDVNFATDGNMPTGTTAGYTAEVEALNDLLIYDSDTAAGAQSPSTTADYSNAQSAVGALIYPSSTDFTVNFNSNGGTGSEASQSAATATDLSLLSTGTIARAGFTFSGWNTAANGTGTAYADGASYPFTASNTLYAQWTATGPFTVTFNNNGGAGSLAPESDSTPTALSLFSTGTMTDPGFHFTGWNTAANGSGTAYADGATYPFTASTTLYAQWAANGTFTVTFNNNGGQGSLPSESEDTPTALTLFQTGNMTQTNSYFTSWNTAANGSGTRYTDGAIYPFTASVTLYAQWMLVNTGPTLLPLGITASSGSIAFGGTFTPSASVTAGLTGGDTATLSGTVFTYTGTGSTTYAASTTAPTAVGTYSVAPSGSTVTVTPAADQSKYSTIYAYVDGALTITAPTLTVTAANVSITVGGSVTPSATVTGLGGTDTATVTTVTYTYAGTGATAYPASTTAPTAAGTYSITPSAATVTVSPAADAANYGTAYSYVAGTLTITAKAKPPVVLHASRIIGSILPGRHSITIVGTGFSGQPKITGTTKGIKVSVSKDTGTRLTVWVTVPKGTRAGHGTFTIRLSNGKTCKVTYTIK
jgi:Listeria-Bacteroides repeat domain (List_Bact_rpt)